jgi:Putative DNA-binding domain
MVAYANSCPVGYPGLLFIGVDDKGNVQRHGTPPNFEEVQKEVSRVINQAYPSIYHYSQTLRKGGLEFVAVTILGSEKRPHFSGKAYIRVGPESKEASDDMYDILIAERSSKLRALRNMIGKTVIWYDTGTAHHVDAVVTACNQFVLTIDGATFKTCLPLSFITISYDPDKGLDILQTGR